MAEKETLRAPSLNKELSRRKMIVHSGMGVASLAIASGVARAGGKPHLEEPGSTDTATSIHQEIDLKASPQRVYEALLDSKQFSAFTGLPAEIHREPGGAFSLFGGAIVGRNVELAPNQRIVQAWRSNGWPEGIYSIVRFDLNKQGPGTRLTMDHRGFPDGQHDHLASGWNEHYWEPLAKYFG